MNSLFNYFNHSNDSPHLQTLHAWVKGHPKAVTAIGAATLATMVSVTLSTSSSLTTKSVVNFTGSSICATLGVLFCRALPAVKGKSTPAFVSHNKNNISSDPCRAPVSRCKQNPLTKKLCALNDDECHDVVIGVYITTNEDGLTTVRNTLSSIAPVPDSFHIGFSGWYNFDIMCMRKSTYGLICDFNAHNKIFIFKTIELLKVSTDRQDFVKEMAAYVTDIEQTSRRQIITVGRKEYMKSGMLFSHNVKGSALFDPIEEVINELIREGSWLSTDESFNYIKTLAIQDRIAAFTANICDTDRFKKVMRFIQENNKAVDTLYLSNISSYISSEEKPLFVDTVHHLIDPETAIIHCPIDLSNRDKDIKQRVDFGKTFRTPEDDKRLFQVC